MTTALSRFFFCAILVTNALCSTSTHASESPRIVQSLDRDWSFHLGAAPDAKDPDFDASGWRRVDVPHDYVVEGAFVENDPTENKGYRPE